MATPKRYSKGVTNVAWNSPLANLPTMAPNKVHLFMDDFQDFLAGAINTGKWTLVTEAADGSCAMGAADGGILVVNAITDGDYTGVQKSLMFTLEAGKQLWMGVRFKIGHATTMAFKVGICDIETDFVPDIGLFWHKVDDAATTQLETYTTGGVKAATTGNVWTPTTSYVVLEAYFDGVDTFYSYADGVYVDKMTTSGFTTTAMTPWLGVDAGATHASTNALTVDYIYVAKER